MHKIFYLFCNISLSTDHVDAEHYLTVPEVLIRLGWIVCSPLSFPSRFVLYIPLFFFFCYHQNK